MKVRILVFCALLAGVSAMARAQAPGAFTMHCALPVVQQNVTPSAAVFTKSCTATATINGIAIKGMTFSAYQVDGPTSNTVWGVIVGTLASGDMIYLRYHDVLPVRNGMAGAGDFTYQFAGGTGAVNGIAGSGSCKVETNATGADYQCAGAYAFK